MKIIDSVSGTGGKISIISGVALNYAALPTPAANYTGKFYLVQEGSGGLLSIVGSYKYPKGVYSPNASNVWELTPFNVKVAEDSTTLINITNWSEFYGYAHDINIGDKLIFNGSSYVNITGSMSATAPDTDSTNWGSYFQLSENFSAPIYKEARLYYDKDSKCYAFYNDQTGSSLSIGREAWRRAKKNSGVGTELVNGTPVFVSSGLNGVAIIEKADCKEFNKSRLVGVVTTTGLNDTAATEGEVAYNGDVNDIDTSYLSVGDVVYLNPEFPVISSIPFTNIRPLNGNFPITIGIVLISDGSGGRIGLNIKSEDYTSETIKKTGWPITVNSYDLSFDDTGIELTITPFGGASEHYFYQDGIKYIKGEESITLPDTSGLYLIYYDEGVLKYLADPTQSQISVGIRLYPFVCYVYWNSISSKHKYLGWECHGIDMSNATHSYQHFSEGARYVSGQALTDILVNQSGNLDTHAQFGVTGGVNFDEDIPIFTPSVASTVGLEVFYLTGLDTNPEFESMTKSGFSVLTDNDTGVGTSGRLVFNELSGGIWGTTVVTNNDFVLCHVFGVNSYTESRRLIAVMGQNQYLTRGQAESGAENEINTLKGAGVLSEEIVALGTVIYQTGSTKTNAVKGSIEESADGGDYKDWRESPPSGNGGGGVTAFTQLTDTPSSYTSYEDYLVKVNNAGTALEFYNPNSLYYEMSKYTNGIFANAIINSNFQIDQYGLVSATPIGVTNNNYYIDQWIVNEPTSGLGAILSLNTDSNNIKSLKILAQNTVASIKMAVFTRVENINTKLFKGQTVTISCEMKTNAPTNAHIEHYDGTTITKSPFATLIDTWEVVELTFAYSNTPSINDEVAFGFGKSSGAYNITAGDYCEIRNVQWCIGSQRLNYNPPKYEMELLKCLRYYNNLASGAAELQLVNGNNYATTLWIGNYTYPVPMRTSPTLSISAAADFSIRGAGVDRVCNSVTLQGTGTNERQSEIRAVTGSSLVANAGTILKTYTVNAKFILKAEM